MHPSPHRLLRASYPVHFDSSVRFAEIDMYGHVNNVEMLRRFEDARVELSLQMSGAAAYQPEHGAAYAVVASQSAVYLQQVRFPSALTIAIGVSRIGSSSYGLGAALFVGEQCCAVHDCAMVQVTAQGSLALSDTQRAQLQQWRIVGADADRG